MPEVVLAFTGMPGCGKGVAVDFLKDKYDLPVVIMGEVVKEEVRARGLPVDSKHVGPLANQMRKEHGMDVWAKRVVEKLSVLENRVVIIDGTRGPDEIACFRKAFGDGLHLIAVMTSTGTRYQRILDRKRDDDTVDVEGFNARDQRELGWGVGRIIATADHYIMNEGSMEQMWDTVDALYTQIVGEG